MNVLGLDPSSTRTGYALMTGPTDILEAGYLTPDRVKDEAMHRIGAMVRDLDDLLRDSRPDWVVIEVTSGKVGRRHRGGGAGLATYGMAVGRMHQLCLSRPQWAGAVAAVYENQWTRGVPKNARRAVVAEAFPAYRQTMGKDGGGDVADAIGLALWFLTLSETDGDDPVGAFSRV